MRRALVLSLLTLLGACSPASTALESDGLAASVRPGLAEVSVPALSMDSRAPVKVLWDHGARRPRRVLGAFATHERVTSGSEPAARAFLARHATLFGLRDDGRDLALASSRDGLAGRYLRFQQHAGALPVLGGEVIVLADRDNVVRMVNLAHHSISSITAPPRDVGADRAWEIAAESVGAFGEAPGQESVLRALWVGASGAAEVVYRVSISTSNPDAAWEVLVGAGSGEVVSARDRIVRVNGTGFVFDPNPVASTGDSTLTDNGGATTPALDAARFSVTLPNLDGTGYTRGSWVDAHTKNLNQRAFNAGLVFNFTRAEKGFEQANVYFHIDRAQTRLQALGFMNVNAHAQDVVTDGQQGDNSYYDPAKKLINYGEGGVDDAEDADIVLHEYGHAIQDDQVPGFGASADAGAMGEGFGDYLATSLAHLLSPQVTDLHCLGEWDATFYAMGNPPCLRRTDTTKHHPEFNAGEVHDDGEMWASALVSLDLTLGADVMNRVVVESHFSLSVSETFFTGSQALLDADTTLFAGAHTDVIRRRLIQQGLCRILTPPSPLSFVSSSVQVSIDNPRTNGVYINHLDDTQSFTFPGAAALRLHFTTIDTELDPTCVDGACDNIYLTDAAGDLYQILAGQQSNVLSVAIPGDTVHVRLVTDPAVTKFGYHIDRVDVLSAAPDGGLGTGGMGGMGAASSSSGGAGGAAMDGGLGGMGGGLGGAGGASSSSTGSSGMMASSSSSSGGVTSSSGGVTSSSSGGEGGGGSGTIVEPEGCGCRVAGEAPNDTTPPWGALSAAFALASLRRRRARVSRRTIRHLDA